jgi:hypothetical protein
LNRRALAQRAPVWLRPSLASVIVTLIFIVIAWQSAWLATRDLDWPYDIDLYRDAAAAQSMMDGKFPADPYYEGERSWYNPLAPAVVGAVARITGLLPAQVEARSGAWIGLAAAFGIGALAMALFGRWPGVGSLFAFLFLGPTRVPGWAAPSYTPWLFPNAVSLIPFAATLVVALRAGKSDRLYLWSLVGALLGVTFLAHTSTAIVAGCIVLALSWQRSKPRTIAARWSVIVSAAFVMGLPLLVTILWHYGLRIKNPAPLNYIAPETAANGLRSLLEQSLNLGNGIALSGFVLLCRDKQLGMARRALVGWIAVCVVMLAHGYARQLWPAANLPGLLPPFHWLFHLRCAGSFLFGYGLYRIIALLTIVAGRFAWVPVSATLVAVLGLTLMFQYRGFASRYDFTEARQNALNWSARPGFAATSNWLRRSTPRDAVILAPPFAAVMVLGSAGRRTVMVDHSFSNPYIPFEPRATAAEAMWRSLADHDRDRFFAAAAKYHVSYVLLEVESRPTPDASATAPFVQIVFAEGLYTVLHVEQ